MRHGSLNAMDEQAEQNRVEGTPDGLVQNRLDNGSTDIKLGLDQSAL